MLVYKAAGDSFAARLDLFNATCMTACLEFVQPMPQAVRPTRASMWPQILVAPLSLQATCSLPATQAFSEETYASIIAYDH